MLSGREIRRGEIQTTHSVSSSTRSRAGAFFLLLLLLQAMSCTLNKTTFLFQLMLHCKNTKATAITDCMHVVKEVNNTLKIMYRSLFAARCLLDISDYGGHLVHVIAHHFPSYFIQNSHHRWRGIYLIHVNI